jgi:hypothetical protein
VERYNPVSATQISPLVETITNLAEENGRLKARVAELERHTDDWPSRKLSRPPITQMFVRETIMDR